MADLCVGHSPLQVAIVVADLSVRHGATHCSALTSIYKLAFPVKLELIFHWGAVYSQQLNANSYWCNHTKICFSQRRKAAKKMRFMAYGHWWFK